MVKFERSKTKKTGQTDWHLWNEVKQTVRPLNRKRIPAASLSGKKTIQSEGSNEFRSKDIPTLTGSSIAELSRAMKRNSFSSTGLSVSCSLDLASPNLPAIEPGVHRHLRRGRIPIDARIDLHGMNRNVARLKLNNFIQERAQRGDRTLLIITGKGQKTSGFGSSTSGGVLRQMLPHWLDEPQLAPFVSGFEVSARHHGGEGAFYVRLRKTSGDLSRISRRSR